MEPTPPPPPTPGPLPPGQMPPGYYPQAYPPPPPTSLLWLWIVLGVVGTVLAVGLAGAIFFTRGGAAARHRTTMRSEAALNVERMFKEVKVYYAERDSIPMETGAPTPPEGSCCSTERTKCEADPALWKAEPWASLDFTIDERHYFSYSFRPEPSGKGFTISAYGDLDCDGKSAVYYQIVGTIRDGYIEKDVTITRGEDD